MRAPPTRARTASGLASWFVLFGGRDGWLGSDTYRDQVEAWKRGTYLRMPLRPEMVEREFPHVVRLEPAGR